MECDAYLTFAMSNYTGLFKQLLKIIYSVTLWIALWMLNWNLLVHSVLLGIIIQLGTGWLKVDFKGFSVTLDYSAFDKIFKLLDIKVKAFQFRLRFSLLGTFYYSSINICAEQQYKVIKIEFQGI